MHEIGGLAHGGHPGIHAAGGARRHAGRHNGDGLAGGHTHIQV
jgi:hypothetical protein